MVLITIVTGAYKPTYGGFLSAWSMSKAFLGEDFRCQSTSGMSWAGHNVQSSPCLKALRLALKAGRCNLPTPNRGLSEFMPNSQIS